MLAADLTAPVPVSAPPPALPGWQALPAGGTMRPVAAAAAPPTGTWRTQRPMLDARRCIHCMFCWVFCPDSAILVEGGRVIGVDYDHCKGCGICAHECPVKPTAIPMVDEAMWRAAAQPALSA